MRDVEAIQNGSDSDIRAALIAAARGLAARQGEFSVPEVCAESGVGREAFYRCFSDKAALLAAIVDGDVAVLGKMVELAEPAKRAVNGGAVSAADTLGQPAPVDQWLERRLRVFERALAALESRQEKSEREFARRVALLEEKIMSPVPAAMDAAPAAAPVMAPAETTLVHQAVESEHPVTPAAEPEQSAPAEEANPISQSEVTDFIATARRAALRAVETPPPSSSMALPRWIAWMGVAAVTLLIGAGLVLSNAGATQTQPVAGIAIRTEAQDALGRLVALADSGDAHAQTLLALAYLRGSYGASDPGAAKRWSLAAARQGVPMAQYLIGSMTGKDDAAKAVSWFEQAALRGNLKAMHNLAIAYAQGQGVGEDDRRAAAWFNRAASQGYVDSQFDLAVLFERGQGVTQNRIAALKWYLIAAKGGDSAAKERADQLRAEMPDSEAEQAQSLAAQFKPQPHDVAANSDT